MAYEDKKELMASKEDCLSQYPTHSEYTGQCPGYWDGLMCWPNTNPGELTTVACPDAPGFYSYNSVTKFCSSNGDWMNKYSTDYSPCVVTDYDYFMNATYNYEYTGPDIEDVEFYHKVMLAQYYINVASLVLLGLALLMWLALWYARHRSQPFRYACYLTAILAGLLHHTNWVVLGNVHLNQAVCRVLSSLLFFSDLVVYSILLAYVILCIVVALRRVATGAQVGLSVLLSVCIPLVVTSLEAILALVFSPSSPSDCRFLDGTDGFFWIVAVPKFVLILLILCIDLVIIYWLLIMDNSSFKTNRDYRVISYGSVCVLVFMMYSVVYEIYLTLTMLHWRNDMMSFSFNRMATMLILSAAKGFMMAIILCFLDLEMLAQCPCGFVNLDSGEFEDTEPLRLMEADEKNLGVVMARDELQGNGTETKSHTSTFEMDLTGNINAQAKPLYGAIPERR